LCLLLVVDGVLEAGFPESHLRPPRPMRRDALGRRDLYAERELKARVENFESASGDHVRGGTSPFLVSVGGDCRGAEL